jgi:mannose-6-phosphate isomerase-like protein (cupin superfamily)
MEIIKNKNIEFVPASHENPLDPGCLKKVLLKRDDVDPGRIQMINWSLLIKNKSFEKHYHEDMLEIFIILSNQATIIVGNKKEIMTKGDSVIINPKEVHQMINETNQDTEYLAIGIAYGTTGKTINV